MKDVLTKAAKIRAIIFDVDGVLTDGSLYIQDNGKEIKAFNSRDGHGMKMLMSTGVNIAIITGRTSNIVTHRMNELGVKHVHQGQKDKYPAFKKLLEELNLDANEVAYVGDDVVDLPVMIHVGLAIAVNDAHPLVKKHAHWTTSISGGRGAAREVCELVMEAQGNLYNLLDKYVRPAD